MAEAGSPSIECRYLVDHGVAALASLAYPAPGLDHDHVLHLIDDDADVCDAAYRWSSEEMWATLPVAEQTSADSHLASSKT